MENVGKLGSTRAEGNERLKHVIVNQSDLENENDSMFRNNDYKQFILLILTIFGHDINSWV